MKVAIISSSAAAAPGSAYLLSGPARIEWEHSVPELDLGTLGNSGCRGGSGKDGRRRDAHVPVGPLMR
jgi:hypothetical protein